MKRTLLLLVLSLAGCQGSRLDTITDTEIRANGEWTASDQLARDLLRATGRDRPVRNPSWWRKLRGHRYGFSASAFLGTLFGLHFDSRYAYLPEFKAYLLLRRDGPPVIVGEEFGQKVELPQPKTPEKAYRAWREQLERELEDLWKHGRPRPAAPWIQP